MSADTCQPSNQSTGTLIVTGVDRRGRLLQDAPRRVPPSRAGPAGDCPAGSNGWIFGPLWSDIRRPKVILGSKGVGSRPLV